MKRLRMDGPTDLSDVQAVLGFLKGIPHFELLQLRTLLAADGVAYRGNSIPVVLSPLVFNNGAAQELNTASTLVSKQWEMALKALLTKSRETILKYMPYYELFERHGLIGHFRHAHNGLPLSGVVRQDWIISETGEPRVIESNNSAAAGNYYTHALAQRLASFYSEHGLPVDMLEGWDSPVDDLLKGILAGWRKVSNKANPRIVIVHSSLAAKGSHPGSTIEQCQTASRWTELGYDTVTLTLEEALASEEEFDIFYWRVILEDVVRYCERAESGEDTATIGKLIKVLSDSDKLVTQTPEMWLAEDKGFMAWMWELLYRMGNISYLPETYLLSDYLEEKAFQGIWHSSVVKLRVGFGAKDIVIGADFEDVEDYRQAVQAMLEGNTQYSPDMFIVQDHVQARTEKVVVFGTDGLVAIDAAANYGSFVVYHDAASGFLVRVSGQTQGPISVNGADSGLAWFLVGPQN